MIRRAESAAAVSSVCPAKKTSGGFHDRENQREERRRDHAEFDGGGAIVLADEFARKLPDAESAKSAPHAMQASFS